MILRCIYCVLSSALLFSLVMQIAEGQSSGASTASAPEKKSRVIYKEKSYYDFEDVLINGNVRAPDGSFIFRKPQSTFSSALNLQRSFIPELKESTRDSR